MLHLLLLLRIWCLPTCKCLRKSKYVSLCLGSRLDTRPTESGLYLQSAFSFRSNCSSARNSLLCSCCCAQAPAPVAFPMTTPQVPVYGMVTSRLISQSFHSFSAGINPFLIWCVCSSPVLHPAPSSDESSDGGRSHDAPTACHVQPACPETHQSFWAHPGDTGNTNTHMNHYSLAYRPGGYSEYSSLQEPHPVVSRLVGQTNKM